VGQTGYRKKRASMAGSRNGRMEGTKTRLRDWHTEARMKRKKPRGKYFPMEILLIRKSIISLQKFPMEII
jgi:hypothetical protein